MMHVKATCKSCEGTGYSMDSGTPSSLRLCKNCKGAGVLILTAEDWDIELGGAPSSERKGGDREEMTMKKSEDADWIDKIEFKHANITDIIELCLKCGTEEEASKLRERYRAFCTTPQVADENLGYIFGYCGEEQRKTLYRLFPVVHPVFGAKFGREVK